MNLAVGEGGNLDTVSGGLVATINGFHGSFQEAGHYADVFAAACNNSALDVDSLSSAMSVAAPIFSAAGYTVNDAALYMGVMANNGIEADNGVIASLALTHVRAGDLPFHMFRANAWNAEKEREAGVVSGTELRGLSVYGRLRL